MPLETAQLLCTTAHLRGFDAPYKITHKNHPVRIWLGQSSANWNWLCEHGIALCNHYTDRYKKIHKCEAIIRDMQCKTQMIWGNSLPSNEHTPFAICMPDQYKKNNAVDSYRAYYIGEKSKIATWEPFGIAPEWFIGQII